ncbi:histidine--tRNA ligase [Kytococcus sp. HMSC28H12]|uniref:histidine--tRNA ligase n=1 Tax=Kytococcus sp. HMSC28H12 TaxID=1581067 RepID=UPI0008A12D34|nr:histidine--tRNA ligase [Kytococcus sp. HMSC28H12]OFS12919.1 histidine--tRNA ligase [Kytococcus sp. HMSC28H12]
MAQITTPRPAQGTLELLPRQQVAFNRIADVVRRHFEAGGFLPLETPAFERTDVLLTKSGGETEKQVYFVQSTGGLANDREAVAAGDEVGLPDLALRFDLTVPMARFVAQHEGQLTFPFRRYQMQRVYRGERPQRGRFREFVQCDVDIIGKDTLSVRHDAEPPATMHAIFRELDFGPFTIHLNNRRLLRGFFRSVGITDEQQPLVLREVDKIDKRGVDWLREELTGERFGLAADVVDAVAGFVSTRTGSHAEALEVLAGLEGRDEELDAGVAELREVLEMLRHLGVPEGDYCVNLAIARGLDYYTGTVYETFLDEHPELGSVCSGGRYENLAGQYTRSSLPGVGMSIGLSRLFWQLMENGMVADEPSTVQVLVPLLDEALLPEALGLAAELRTAGLRVESVLEPAKLAKQFKHADRAGIRFVAVLGAQEVERGVVMVKDLQRGDQFEAERGDLAQALRVELAQPVAVRGD